MPNKKKRRNARKKNKILQKTSINSKKSHRNKIEKKEEEDAEKEKSERDHPWNKMVVSVRVGIRTDPTKGVLYNFYALNFHFTRHLR